METPIEHILSAFDDVRWYYFTGVAIVGFFVVLLAVLRKGRKPSALTWSKKTGWTPALEARRDDATPKQLEEMRRKLGLTEEEFRKIYR